MKKITALTTRFDAAGKKITELLAREGDDTFALDITGTVHEPLLDPDNLSVAQKLLEAGALEGEWRKLRAVNEETLFQTLDRIFRPNT